MGCFYTGFDYKNRKNGYFKIGETMFNTPARRLATIRHSDCFQCLAWLEMKGETQNERRAVEAMVRVRMERLEGMTAMQNDHFSYAIEQGKKYEQANELAEMAIQFAIEECERMGIQWVRGTKTYKRG